MIEFLRRTLPFMGKAAPVVSVVSLNGVIAPDTKRGRNISLASTEDALEKAFAQRGRKAVILQINSPGGAPVQSHLILRRARELAEEKNVTCISCIEDVGASGGYMIALAGEEIYADPFAIVGSIGVISGGFGFVEAIDKIGVERRVYTAGENKSQLDPFRPEDPRDVAHLEDLLEKSHTLFIETVKDRRKDRLKAADDKIFTGEFWIAGDAKELGLIDGVESFRSVITRRFGKDVKVKRFGGAKRGLLARLLGARLDAGPGAGPGAGLDPGALLEAMEERAVWARFGR